jgi:predicted ATPase
LARARCRAKLDAVLAGAEGGRGRMALVAGEPGIGKTRLAGEAARRAAAAGMQVAWGRCHEGDGAPALWPWGQVVAQLAAELAPGQLAAMLGPSAAWLGQLMPERAGPAPPLPIAGLEAARFQLNQAVAGLLRRLAWPTLRRPATPQASSHADAVQRRCHSIAQTSARQ